MRTTVLVVDDHEGFRACARRLLEGDGFEVVGEAADATSGIEAARGLHPDLVLLDVQLPDLDGLQASKRIGALNGGSAIVLTSSCDPTDILGSLVREPGARLHPQVGAERRGHPGAARLTMGKLTFDISMSLDGFIAGPNMSPGKGLGEGGERLHEWAYGLQAFREPHGEAGGGHERRLRGPRGGAQRPGAVVMGKGMFGGGPDPGRTRPGETGRGKDGGATSLRSTSRCSSSPTTLESRSVKGETTFTFVTDGIESALEQARAAAGDEDVAVGGGASVIQQYLAAGLVDEFQIHVAPILLGRGVRLFDDRGSENVELECTRVIDSEAVTHLKYRVVR